MREGRELKLWAGHEPGRRQIDDNVEQPAVSQPVPEAAETSARDHGLTCPWRGAA